MILSVNLQTVSYSWVAEWPLCLPSNQWVVGLILTNFRNLQFRNWAQMPLIIGCWLRNSRSWSSTRVCTWYNHPSLSLIVELNAFPTSIGNTILYTYFKAFQIKECKKEDTVLKRRKRAHSVRGLSLVWVGLYLARMYCTLSAAGHHPHILGYTTVDNHFHWWFHLGFSARAAHSLAAPALLLLSFYLHASHSRWVIFLYRCYLSDHCYRVTGTYSQSRYNSFSYWLLQFCKEQFKYKK